jgi:hypothetical protein
VQRFEVLVNFRSTSWASGQRELRDFLARAIESLTVGPKREQLVGY